MAPSCGPGTDDGRVHVTRDGGDETWMEITPDDMPTEGTVNSIDLSTNTPGRAVMAVFKYRDGDFRPYVFRTTDWGENWDLLLTRWLERNPGRPSRSSGQGRPRSRGATLCRDRVRDVRLLRRR